MDEYADLGIDGGTESVIPYSPPDPYRIYEPCISKGVPMIRYRNIPYVEPVKRDKRRAQDECSNA